MKKYISEPTIQCKECKKWFRWINHNHLRKHGLNTDKYKEKWKILYTEGLTSETFKEYKSARQYELKKRGRVKFIDSDLSKKLKKQGIPKPRLSPAHLEIIKRHKERMKNEWKNNPKIFNGLKIGQQKKGYGLINQYPQKEKEVIEDLIKSGISDRIIAFKLGISIGAVQNHRINWLGIKVEDGLWRISHRKELNCEICQKRFIAYIYPNSKFINNRVRRFCSNKCRGIAAKTGLIKLYLPNLKAMKPENK